MCSVVFRRIDLKAAMSITILHNRQKARFDFSQFVVPSVVFFYLGKLLFQVFIYLKAILFIKDGSLHDDRAPLKSQIKFS